MKKQTEETTLHAGKKYVQWTDSNGSSFWIPEKLPENQQTIPPLARWNGAKIPYRLWKTFQEYGRKCCAEELSECMCTIMARDAKGNTQAALDLWAFPQFCCTGLTVNENPGNPLYAQKMDWYRSEGFYPYGTIHTHAAISASQSSVDEKDECMFEGIHITLGHLDKEKHDVHSRFIGKATREGDPAPTYYQQQVAWSDFIELPSIFNKEEALAMSGSIGSLIEEVLLWKAQPHQFDQALLDIWMSLRSPKPAPVYPKHDFGPSRSVAHYGGGYGDDYFKTGGYGNAKYATFGSKFSMSGTQVGNNLTLAGPKPAAKNRGRKPKVVAGPWELAKNWVTERDDISLDKEFLSTIINLSIPMEQLKTIDNNTEEAIEIVYNNILETALPEIADFIENNVYAKPMHLASVQGPGATQFIAELVDSEDGGDCVGLVASYECVYNLLSLMDVLSIEPADIELKGFHKVVAAIIADMISETFCVEMSYVADVSDDISDACYEALEATLPIDQSSLAFSILAKEVVPLDAFNKAVVDMKACISKDLDYNFTEILAGLKWISLASVYCEVNDKVVHLPFYECDEYSLLASLDEDFLLSMSEISQSYETEMKR